MLSLFYSPHPHILCNGHGDENQVTVNRLSNYRFMNISQKRYFCKLLSAEDVFFSGFIHTVSICYRLGIEWIYLVRKKNPGTHWIQNERYSAHPAHSGLITDVRMFL